MPRLTGIGVRHRLLAYADTGVTQADIAERVGITHETVIRILMRNWETGSLVPGKSTGSPRVSSQRDDRVLGRIARQDRSKSCESLRAEWIQGTNIQASTRTVNRRLEDMDYRARRSAVKPMLTPKHKREHLALALEHRNLTVQHWQHVVFGDESRFLSFPVDGRMRVRTRAGEHLKDDCVQAQVAGGGGSVYVWGAFCAHGKSHLVILDRNVTGDVYRQVLDQNLLPWARGLFGNNFWYQNDNAPAHRARVVTTYIEGQDMNVLRQPARSSDLNPIDHLWDQLDRAIRQRDSQPSTLRELGQALLEEWNRIPAERLGQLVDSMPRSLVDIVAARGGHTHY